MSYSVIDFETYIRDLCLKSITEGLEIKVSEERYQEFIKSNLYQTYITEHPDAAITGSAALRLFDMVDREFESNQFLDKLKKSFLNPIKKRYVSYVSDLDVINKSFNTPTISTRYSNFLNTSVLEDYHGSNHYPGDVTVDMFIKDNFSTIKYKDLIINSPFDVIKQKGRMVSSGARNYHKHYDDLTFIFNKFGVKPLVKN